MQECRCGLDCEKEGLALSHLLCDTIKARHWQSFKANKYKNEQSTGWFGFRIWIKNLEKGLSNINMQKSTYKWGGENGPRWSFYTGFCYNLSGIVKSRTGSIWPKDPIFGIGFSKMIRCFDSKFQQRLEGFFSSDHKHTKTVFPSWLLSQNKYLR